MISRRGVFLSFGGLAVAGASSGPTQSLASAAAGPHGQAASVFIAGNRPIVMMRTRGGPPAPMVFDTGTSGNALDTSYAELVGATATDTVEIIDGATGRRVEGAYQTHLNDVSIGGISVGDQLASVYPRSAVNEAGIVGPNAFGRRLVMMDLGRSRLYVRPLTVDAEPIGPAQPYMVRDAGVKMPSAEVHLPGLTTEAMLDSGNDGDLSLPLDMADRLPLRNRPIEVGRAVSASGSQPVYEAELVGVLNIGPLALTNPTLQFKGRVPNVGAGILKRLVIVLDPTGEKSWVLRPGPARSPLIEYEGRYRNVTVFLEGEQLFYRRDGLEPRPLTVYEGDLFEMSGPVAHVQFVREAGRVAGLDLLSRNFVAMPRSPG